ncbi:MAG: aldose epimerase family protein, partial [Desulfobulbia bacterium]
MDIVREVFGTCEESTIHRYTISNDSGVSLAVLNFGAIISSLKVPDRRGELADIVLGYDTLSEYIEDEVYIGSLVGRYANRISGGLFHLGKTPYQLTRNRPGLHLHGGKSGFNKKIWKTEIIREERGLGLKLSMISPDGDEGYPGNLQVGVSYVLTADNELIIDYEAETDKTTVVNLTQHSYFNLAGQGDIGGHHIEINAS